MYQPEGVASRYHRHGHEQQAHHLDGEADPKRLHLRGGYRVSGRQLIPIQQRGYATKDAWTQYYKCIAGDGYTAIMISKLVNSLNF